MISFSICEENWPCHDEQATMHKETAGDWKLCYWEREDFTSKFITENESDSTQIWQQWRKKTEEKNRQKYKQYPKMKCDKHHFSSLASLVQTNSLLVYLLTISHLYVMEEGLICMNNSQAYKKSPVPYLWCHCCRCTKWRQSHMEVGTVPAECCAGMKEAHQVGTHHSSKSQLKLQWPITSKAASHLED